MSQKSTGWSPFARLRRWRSQHHVFWPSTWARIHYDVVLNQVEIHSRVPLFDDAYFDALAKRRDEKKAQAVRVISTNFIVLILLGMTAFGLAPKVEVQGIEIALDRLKEMLLLFHAAGTTTAVLMNNDLLVMREMLRARFERKLRLGGDLNPELHLRAFNAYDLRYLDPVGEATAFHILDFYDPSPPMIARRNAFVTLMAATMGFVLAGCMLFLQGAVIYDVIVKPSFHWLISWSVAGVSILSALLWLAFKLPYCAPKTPDEMMGTDGTASEDKGWGPGLNKLKAENPDLQEI